ncbi:MAG: hypothetical protein LBP75_00755 [Planctomycetota bacterium]|jgi:hypothetical protein|nr:hypothetical protein [Planctomycetota bacterium]
MNATLTALLKKRPYRVAEKDETDILQLFREIQEQSRRNGLDRMTMEDIDAEIAEVRREMRREQLASGL